MTRILHLSDTHVSATGTDMDGVDAIAALERLLHDLRHLSELDLVVVSGDVADDGTAEGCRAVRDRVGAFAAARGVPQVYCTGNHDDRAAFRDTLGTGHLGADGTDRGRLLEPSGELRAAVSDLDGLRVITLDTLVPGHVHGVVGDRQLALLTDLLESPAERGSLLVLHHPPLRPPPLPYAAEVSLRDVDGLTEALHGSDVRVVLAGHLHLQLSGSLSGVPVWVTPGVVTRVDATAPTGVLRAVLGAGATVVDLPEPQDRDGPTFLVVHARDPRAGEEVYVCDPLTGADVVEDPTGD